MNASLDDMRLFSMPKGFGCDEIAELCYPPWTFPHWKCKWVIRAAKALLHKGQTSWPASDMFVSHIKHHYTGVHNFLMTLASSPHLYDPGYFRTEHRTCTVNHFVSVLMNEPDVFLAHRPTDPGTEADLGAYFELTNLLRHVKTWDRINYPEPPKIYASTKLIDALVPLSVLHTPFPPGHFLLKIGFIANAIAQSEEDYAVLVATMIHHRTTVAPLVKDPILKLFLESGDTEALSRNALLSLFPPIKRKQGDITVWCGKTPGDEGAVAAELINAILPFLYDKLGTVALASAQGTADVGFLSDMQKEAIVAHQRALAEKKLVEQQKEIAALKRTTDDHMAIVAGGRANWGIMKTYQRHSIDAQDKAARLEAENIELKARLEQAESKAKKQAHHSAKRAHGTIAKLETENKLEHRKFKELRAEDRLRNRECQGDAYNVNDDYDGFDSEMSDEEDIKHGPSWSESPDKGSASPEKVDTHSAKVLASTSPEKKQKTETEAEARPLDRDDAVERWLETRPEVNCRIRYNAWASDCGLEPQFIFSGKGPDYGRCMMRFNRAKGRKDPSLGQLYDVLFKKSL